jgi:hypothetical protein
VTLFGGLVLWRPLYESLTPKLTAAYDNYKIRDN